MSEKEEKGRMFVPAYRPMIVEMRPGNKKPDSAWLQDVTDKTYYDIPLAEILQAFKNWLTSRELPATPQPDTLARFLDLLKNAEITKEGDLCRITMPDPIDAIPPPRIKTIRGRWAVAMDDSRRFRIGSFAFNDYQMMQLVYQVLTELPLRGQDDPRLAFLGAIDAMRIQNALIPAQRIVLPMEYPVPRKL
jgi:hypothetical protein